MSSETRLRVNENGRVVIPASFRKALGINAGDEVVLRIEDDELRITTLKRRLERSRLQRFGCTASGYITAGGLQRHDIVACAATIEGPSSLDLATRHNT